MKKIFTFIINNDGKLLILKGSPNDPQFHKSFWYVVTGGKEKEDRYLEDTVRREVKEETNLDVYQSIFLNWIFKYESLGEKCVEYAFISWVNEGEIILNEENIDYRWCSIGEFLNLIEWSGDKERLRKVLEYAVQRKKYFKFPKIQKD